MKTEKQPMVLARAKKGRGFRRKVSPNLLSGKKRLQDNYHISALMAGNFFTTANFMEQKPPLSGPLPQRLRSFFFSANNS